MKDEAHAGFERVIGQLAVAESKNEQGAVRGETLATERALNLTTISLSENTERMMARISDIEIAYVRTPMTVVTRVSVG